MLYYAHSANAAGRRHDLREHLLQVANVAARFAEPFQGNQLAYLAGIAHDIGKLHPTFQQYLLAAEQHQTAPVRSQDHKGAGAVWASEAQLDVLVPLIQGHHGGLRDLADTKAWLAERMQDGAVQHALHLARSRWADLLRSPADPTMLLPTALETRESTELCIRMLFSTLVDADFLDTEQHFALARSSKRSGVTPTVGMEHLWEVFATYQDKQQQNAPATLVNEARRKIYQQSCAAAQLAPGFFRLTVPTGGGKTRSSLAFALRHASIHGLRRVIYAIPYTSITEQTADVFRGIFPQPGMVLEHHSALQPVEEAERLSWGQFWQRLASENWDAPLIVTTTVQLFESLLARSTSACRKLHNIAGSVLVLDEAQMLPTHVLETVLDVLAQLVAHYQVSVVFCTATQPALDSRSGFPGIAGVREIVPDHQDLFTTLSRVKYHWPPAGEQWSWHEVARRMMQASQAMVIVNTRDDALQMAHALEASGCSPLHLSASLCGLHRRVVLREVRRRLRAGEPCYLVATQVVEAGVDLDFPLVLRALGPLDRIAQAAGRCNREGRLAQGTVIVFRPEENHLPPGPYRTGTMLTETMLLEGTLDLDDPQTYRTYFARYYARIDRDEPHVQEVRRALNYPEVARRFRLLQEEATPVVVSYHPPNQPPRLLDVLARMRQHPEQGRRYFRQLQPYLANLRAREVAWAQKEGCLEPIIEGLSLWTGPYDPVYGIRTDLQR